MPSGENVAGIDRGWAGRGLIGLPNIEALGKRNGLGKRKARTRGSVRKSMSMAGLRTRVLSTVHSSSSTTA